MKHLLVTLAASLAASPALAHPEAAAHVHGTEGALWGAGLVALAIGAAALRRLPRSARG